jgi:hypothetical protein
VLFASVHQGEDVLAAVPRRFALKMPGHSEKDGISELGVGLEVSVSPLSV